MADDETWENEAMVAALAAQRVMALDGSIVRLRHVWGERPVAQIFLRQFGCLFCHQMVAAVLGAAPAIARAGGHVVLLGCGTPEQAARFAHDKGLPQGSVALFADPTRETYETASLERGYGKTFFNGPSRRAYVRARAEGHRITGIAGDVAQLGGVFVIAPPANLLYAHRSRFAGDHPDPEAIVAAFRSAAAGRAAV